MLLQSNKPSWEESQSQDRAAKSSLHGVPGQREGWWDGTESTTDSTDDRDITI